MTNFSFIELAVKYIINWQESQYYTSINWNKAYAGVTDWWQNTGIENPKLLAAAVLYWGPVYCSQCSCSKIYLIAKDYFEEKEI